MFLTHFFIKNRLSHLKIKSNIHNYILGFTRFNLSNSQEQNAVSRNINIRSQFYDEMNDYFKILHNNNEHTDFHNCVEDLEIHLCFSQSVCFQFKRSET